MNLNLSDGGACVPRVPDLPTGGLQAYLSTRTDTPLNDVIIQEILLRVQVLGVGRRRNAKLQWEITGRNDTEEPLAALILRVSGDDYVPFNELGVKVQDLDAGSDDWRPARLAGGDLTVKEVLLPFLAPGVLPGQPFGLRAIYTWPEMVNTRRDYWYFDPSILGRSVGQFSFEMDCEHSCFQGAELVKVDLLSGECASRGTVSIDHTDDSDSLSVSLPAPITQDLHLLRLEGRSGVLEVEVNVAEHRVWLTASSTGSEADYVAGWEASMGPVGFAVLRSLFVDSLGKKTVKRVLGEPIAWEDLWVQVQLTSGTREDHKTAGMLRHEYRANRGSCRRQLKDRFDDAVAAAIRETQVLCLDIPKGKGNRAGAIRLYAAPGCQVRIHLHADDPIG